MPEGADDIGEMLAATAARIFADHFPDDALRRIGAGKLPKDGWNAIADAGLPLALVSESSGGAALDCVQATGLFKAAGMHAAPVPLAETVLANRLLDLAGLDVAEGIACVLPPRGDEAVSITPENGSWRIRGNATGVAWARHATMLVACAEQDGTLQVARLAPDALTISEGHGINGHPYDSVSIDTLVADDAVGTAGLTLRSVMAAGATLRVMLMAGAFERVLDMTASYARERVQFGRPIGKRQAIQQQLAILAGAVATANAAADMAADSFCSKEGVPVVAAAKAVASESVARAASIAHQVHGAIGFTQEYPLHFLTKCLWQWRDDFGSEADWGRALGRLVVAAGPDKLWAGITAHGAGAGR